MFLQKYFKKYWHHYMIGLIALVIVDVATLQVPIITKRVTDGLQTGTIDHGMLRKEFLYILTIGILVVIMRFIWRYFLFGTARKIEYGLRNDFFEHLETLSASYYNKHKTGDLMAYATNDLNAIRMLVGPGILMIVDATLLTIIIIGQMLYTTDVKLTLLAMAPMPLIAGMSLYLGKYIRMRFKEKQAAFAHLSDVVQENISGIRVIKAFVQETKEMKAFAEINKENYDKNMRVAKVQALMMPFSMLITGVSVFIVIIYGGQLAMIGRISLGDFVAFIQYIMMLFWPMIAFGWFINVYSQGMASIQRFQEIFGIKGEVYDKEGLKEVEETKLGDISIRDLSFTYEGEEHPTLEHIHMDIKKGMQIGIVGRTGSGKTTFVNLLIRMFNAPEGSIIYNGKSIYEYSLKKLRRSIGYVPQDNFLFSDSIANNIGFGVDNFTQEAIEKVAEHVDVHHNIIEFQDGYETIVGERGVTLSGGQKQRISIARALLKEPEILILDDAVSAVDTKTEEKILGHLREVRKGQTTFMIAHRISTVQDADYIYVFDKGKVIEEGNHKELLLLKGHYYHMYKKQQLEKSIAERE